MARWSPENDTLHVKVVYYGPACSGKTSNLAVLHRIAAARRGHELLTVKTPRDGTMFFDLLLFDLDDILGRRVAFKLYTVPGPVRHDATRKVLLGGADAVVFVADSCPSRREQNVWSLQNLRMNLRARCTDAEHVPILFQINKRDLPDAAPAAEVAEWLRLTNEQVIPAVATRGEGVLETFKSACHAVLEHAFHGSEHLFGPIDADALARAVDRALAPYADRLALGWPGGRLGDPPATPIVLSEGDLFEGALEASLRLGEGRSTEAARARRLAREADGFRRLGESLGEFGSHADRPRAVATALAIARDVLDATAVTLITQSPAGPLQQEGAVGWDEDPLLGFASGRRLLRRLVAAEGPCVVDDLDEHWEAAETGTAVCRLRSVAAVPVADDGKRALVAYAGRPDDFFEQDDVRFLESVARHLEAGLDKIRAHEELERHRRRLEQGSDAPARRRTRRPRRAVDRIRERLLANLSNEMRAPLAAVARATTALRDFEGDAGGRGRLVESIGGAAALLERQRQELSRLAHAFDDVRLRPADAQAQRLVEEAIRRAGHEGVSSEVRKNPGVGRFDLEALSRAVANLIDNAVKVSPPEAPVCVRLDAGRIDTPAGEAEALTVSVVDRGPGVPDKDRERIFAPFARGRRAGAADGLGLGLYEARSLAQRHGGRLEHRPRKGGGSEFRLTVPLQPIAEQAAMEVTRA